MVKPHPFAMLGVGLSLQGSLCIVTPPPFGSPATFLQERGP